MACRCYLHLRPFVVDFTPHQSRRQLDIHNPLHAICDSSQLDEFFIKIYTGLITVARLTEIVITEVVSAAESDASVNDNVTPNIPP